VAGEVYEAGNRQAQSANVEMAIVQVREVPSSSALRGAAAVAVLQRRAKTVGGVLSCSEKSRIYGIEILFAHVIRI